MPYREIKPGPRLAPFVKCFWCMERDYSVPGAEEVVWPDGKTELLFLAGEGYRHAGQPLPPAVLIGPLTRPVTLTSPGVTRLAGIRFHPWGLWPFHRSPVRQVRDRVVPYTALAVEAGAQELASMAPEESAAALEQALLRRLDSEPVENHPLVFPLAAAVVDSEGTLPIPELEQRGGVSARHLERLFQEVVGLTPKKLSVIVRFDKARRALFWNPRTDITDVAHELGYYDQSHFIRDFRAHFGMTPGDFKAWTERQRATMARPARVGFLQAEPS